jgi:hypothetical protein
VVVVAAVDWATKDRLTAFLRAAVAEACVEERVIEALSVDDWSTNADGPRLEAYVKLPASVELQPHSRPARPLCSRRRWW